MLPQKQTWAYLLYNTCRHLLKRFSNCILVLKSHGFTMAKQQSCKPVCMKGSFFFGRLLPLCVIISLVFSAKSFSQDTSQQGIVDITRLTLVGPGIEYEKKVGQFQSLSVAAFGSIAYALGVSSSQGINQSYSIDPALGLTYRHYYNYERRTEKGKRTDMNNLNFFGAYYESVFTKNALARTHLAEEKRRAVNNFGLLWGFQRNFYSRISVTFTVGYGYSVTTATEYLKDGTNNTRTFNYGRFGLTQGFTFGFWLNKRK